jgi:hypothetical protein
MKPFTGKFLATCMVVLALQGCGDDEASTSKGSETAPTDSVESAGTVSATGIAGKWRIVAVDGKDLRDDEQYSRIRHDFLADGTWVLSQTIQEGDSSVTGFGGGIWRFDTLTRELTEMSLPDSTLIVSVVLEMKENRMMLRSLESGRTFTWERER